MNRREALKAMAVAGAAAAGAIPALGASQTGAATTKPAGTADAEKPLEREDIQFRLETSLKRVYPTSLAGSAQALQLLAGRNQKLSFQACFGNRKTNSVRVKCDVAGATDG